MPMTRSTAPPPLYRQLATHYRGAIEAGSLRPGERMPSLRSLMRLHDISLSTALQMCRTLESDGWAEARARSGYFVRQPQRLRMAPMDEPPAGQRPDPAQYVGIHARVSAFVSQRRAADIKLNFSIARAAPALYPAEALRAGMTRALRLRPELLAGVPPLQGDPHFREVLAKRSLAGGMTLAPEEVLITNGCIEALNLALRAVAKPGDTIAVESPTFYGLLQVLESLGLRALEIPTSPQTGLSIEALELALQTYDDIRAVVVIPHLQNPLGSVMPDAHKARLVRLCEQQQIALIEDDTYTELLDVETTPRAIKSWDRSGNVIHCASMHKILAPGMRLGWIAAGRWQARVEMLKYAQTRNTEVLSQLGAGGFMGTGAYDRHLRRLRSALRVQREQTAEGIARYFPAGTRLNLPNGGLQLWVELPDKLSSSGVFDAALAHGILVAPGFLFSNSPRFDHYLRINCGWPYDDAIDAGLKRLGQLVDSARRAAPA
ncbi:aminotransferase-like domain-containing protein [Variovorax sp. PAMC 28711]|uniref:aminotransferase-like domain-containing protein n=1 Tax=Variovorax sp. PAMC 28711 TaxID=1795631 RepID=UPI00078B7150|nr:PLP-dependent aminotransferase family protein [Variovorax sp. PAMC 28711]AMM24659.1 2-aminoadipate aminotransferase [Variovorax sp. PAMC 28711]